MTKTSLLPYLSFLSLESNEGSNRQVWTARVRPVTRHTVSVIDYLRYIMKGFGILPSHTC